MAAQYFIKCGKKINGPFSVEKLRALKKAKKLKADDEISQSAEGPWIAFCEVYEGILSKGNDTKIVKRKREHSRKPSAKRQNGIVHPAQRALPRVLDIDVTKCFTGKWFAFYQCPICKADIKSTEEEVVEEDESCPECGGRYVFAEDACAQIELEKQRLKKIAGPARPTNRFMFLLHWTLSKGAETWPGLFFTVPWTAFMVLVVMSEVKGQSLQTKEKLLYFGFGTVFPIPAIPWILLNILDRFGVDIGIVSSARYEVNAYGRM